MKKLTASEELRAHRLKVAKIAALSTAAVVSVSLVTIGTVLTVALLTMDFDFDEPMRFYPYQ